MERFRRIGYSDKVFQYKTERNLRIRVLLKHALDLDALKNASRLALNDFPEYMVAPVIRNGEVLYMFNDRDMAFFPYDETERYFGSEEVNGHLMFILYEDDAFVLSLFHGLTDYKGMCAFLHNLIYYYATGIGREVSDIRAEQPDMDDTERFDPYSKYCDINSRELIPLPSNEVFRISEEKIPEKLHRQHEYILSTDAPRFIALSKEWKSSATAVLAALITNALDDIYDVGDKDIALKITCDMRGCFDSKTRVNMSEAVVLISDRRLREAPLDEHSRVLRTMMKEQLTAGNFRKIMCEGISNAKLLSREISEPEVKLSHPPLTYVLTYPGKMDLPDDYSDIVTDFELKGYFPVDSIRFSIKTTGDELRLSVAQVFDDDKVIRAIADQFGKLGFDTAVRDGGLFGGDLYSLDKIRVL